MNNKVNCASCNKTKMALTMSIGGTWERLASNPLSKAQMLMDTFGKIRRIVSPKSAHSKLHAGGHEHIGIVLVCGQTTMVLQPVPAAPVSRNSILMLGPRPL